VNVGPFTGRGYVGVKEEGRNPDTRNGFVTRMAVFDMAEDAPPAGDKTVTLTGKLTKEEKADANGKNVATYIVTDDAGVAKELPALMALDVKLAAAVGTMVTVTCKADEQGNPVKVMTVAPVEQAGAGAAAGAPKHEKVAKAKHSGKAKKKNNNM